MGDGRRSRLACSPRQRWQWWRRRVHLLNEIADYNRQRDPAENAESTPPADEEIRLQAVWMAESYPLSFFDVLLDAVRLLTAEGHRLGEPPAERIEESLRLGSSGWFPLGPLVPPGSPFFRHSTPIEVALPANVEYAYASVHYLVPSQVMLIVCFVLDDAGSRRGEETLRTTYESARTARGTANLAGL